MTQPPSDDKPVIWYTKWMTDLDTQVVFDYLCRGGQESKLAYSRAVRYCWPVDDAHISDYLYFGPRGDSKVKPPCRDAFKIIDGLLVVSQAFCDVLVQHELGATRLHEVPVHRDERGAPSDLPPHYLLHVTEGKPGTFAPEHSTNVEQLKRYDEAEPRPDAPWIDLYNKDELAVHAASAAGADLWHDPALRERLFLSDRLARAIKEAGLKSRALRFVSAKVV